MNEDAKTKQGCPAEREWVSNHGGLTLKCDLLKTHTMIISRPPHPDSPNQNKHRTTINDSIVIYWKAE